MKLIPVLMLSLVTTIFACSKSAADNPDFPDGIYTGTFQRMHQENSPLASVTINFNFPDWTGASNINHYPALGNGTFKYVHDALTFENGSVWTADFDWTLILKDSYIDRIKGDSLIFFKSYSNGWVDVYKLKKQPDNE